MHNALKCVLNLIRKSHRAFGIKYVVLQSMFLVLLNYLVSLFIGVFVNMAVSIFLYDFIVCILNMHAMLFVTGRSTCEKSIFRWP